MYYFCFLSYPVIIKNCSIYKGTIFYEWTITTYGYSQWLDNRLSDKQSDTGRDAVVTELAECFGRKPEIFFRYVRSMDRCFWWSRWTAFRQRAGLSIIFRAYRKPCATIGKTKNTHYQSVDVCRCNGCNCFFLWNDCLSEWKESTPESIDTDYGGSSIRFKNQTVSSWWNVGLA